MSTPFTHLYYNNKLLEISKAQDLKIFTVISMDIQKTTITFDNF